MLHGNNFIICDPLSDLIVLKLHFNFFVIQRDKPMGSGAFGVAAIDSKTN